MAGAPSTFPEGRGRAKGGTFLDYPNSGAHLKSSWKGLLALPGMKPEDSNDLSAIRSRERWQRAPELLLESAALLPAGPHRGPQLATFPAHKVTRLTVGQIGFSE